MVAVTYHYLRNTCNLYKGIHPIDWYTFVNQMDYLKKSKSTLFINENLESYLDNYKYNLDEGKFIVTFDDGLKEHFEAAEILARKGIKSILLTSEKAIDSHGFDFSIRIPSRDTARIQESHILIGHLLCGIVERNIFA